MGLNVMFSSSSSGYITEPLPPNPSPKRWAPVCGEVVNGHILLELIYNGVTTYEGRKLLLMPRGWQLPASREIDPHFREDNLHPLARFRPNELGWKMARAAAKAAS